MPCAIPAVEFCCGAQLESGDPLRPSEFLNPCQYREAMQCVSKVGYTWVEFPHLAHLSAEEAVVLKAHTEEVGLKPWATHSKVLTEESPDAHRRYRQEQRICARNAEILGVRVIVDHVGVEGVDEDIDRDAERLKESARVAADHGLEMAVENPLTLSVEYTRRVVDAIGEAHVGCCCDTGHALVNGTAPHDAVHIMGDKLFNTHLHDGFGEQDDHLPPGIGRMDWGRIVRALFEVGFDRPWMLEISGHKAHRKSAELRDLGLERVMVIGLRFLQYHVEQYVSKQRGNAQRGPNGPAD